MNSRTILHALTTLLVTVALVGAGQLTTAPPADAAALLKQRAHGQLNAPVKPGTFRVSQRFHGGHDGIDLAAPTGTPVRAVARGRVVKVRKWRHSYGKHVVLKHRGGRSLSAHLSGIQVRKGQRIDRGQVIGRVGSTGNSTGPHLHFVLKSRGRTVDPARFFWR
jgi:murein DD-endopeptidase MepM/ murein hydrolase activator NlpD